MVLLLVLRMMPEPTVSPAPRLSLPLKYSLFTGQACAHGFVSLPWAVHLLRSQHGLNHPSFVLVRGRSSSVYRCSLWFLMRAACALIRSLTHTSPLSLVLPQACSPHSSAQVVFPANFQHFCKCFNKNGPWTACAGSALIACGHGSKILNVTKCSRRIQESVYNKNKIILGAALKNTFTE
jgi:hypothetical protein